MNPTDYYEMYLRGCDPFDAVTKKGLFLGRSLVVASQIIPDFKVGTVIGIHLLSGISFNTRINSWKQTIKERWSLR